MPLKILQLTVSFAEGGRRRAITTLLKQLGALGVSCDLACVQQLGCPSEEALEVAGAVEVLQQRSLLDRGAVSRLRDFCRRRGIDVIHAHDASAQFVAARMRLGGPRGPLLMTFHRSLGFESARFRDKLRNAFACSMSAAIVTGSRERRDHFLRENYVDPKKMVRIPFGIDTKRFHPDASAREALRAELGLEPGTVVLGAVGHFREVKGIDLVVRAFQQLSVRELPVPVALVVVGDGPPERWQLLQELANAGPGRVIFAGFRRDVERWFQGFDVFVHGARLEAFGLVLAEAMASGLPVVAPRIGGIPDIVRDGETGLLTQPEASDAWADALERLLQDEEVRIRMGDEGRRVALLEFSAERYAERHLRLYLDLLAGRPLRGADEDETEPVEVPSPVPGLDARLESSTSRPISGCP